MTKINELQRIVEHARSLSNKKDKLDYLNQQPRSILNFLSGNIKKDGIAKAIASEIPICEESISNMEIIIGLFNEASKQSKKRYKIAGMKSICLSQKDREFVLTTLYGSLKLGVTIPIPEPEFGESLNPMLCNTKFIYNPSNYIEKKFNGHRCITTNIDNKIYTYTRNGKILDINDFIKEYFKLAIPPGTTVDGEIIDPTGDFFSLKRKSNDIIYQIFDIIFVNNKSINNLSLRDRLNILKDNIEENDHVKISKEIKFNSIEEIDMWIIKNNVEGIISKDLDSPYIYGSRKTWSKYKHFRDITCDVIGFTRGTGKRDRDDMIGAIQVIPEGSNIISKVGSGFKDSDLIQIKQFINDNKKIKIDCKYQEITPNGAMQFPIFLRIREVL